MALLHWWPLNGNTQDYGSTPIVLTNSGATIDNSGKIGSCYKFTSTQMYGQSIIPVKFSCSAWVYFTTNNSAQYVFQLGGAGSYSAKYALDQDNGIYHILLNGSDYATNISTQLNTWVHLTFTYNNATAIFYVNGIQKWSANNTNSFNGLNNIVLGARGNNTALTDFAYKMNNARMNDVRIYDHCLTPQEVAEIARAKILHYPLDNNGWGARLPSGYQQVEYLESTGTQWIDTGIGGFLQAIQDVEFNTSITTRQLMGQSSSDPYWGRAANGKFELNGSVVTQRIMATDRHKIVYTVDTVHHSSLLIDDDELIEQNKTNNLTYSSNYHLFHINGYNGLQSSVKLWYCKIVQNNRLVFHGIPCYRKSDGKPGLYDLVSNTFLTNSGSGEFLLGPSVGLPADYQQVEYIENTNTAYINTKLVSKNFYLTHTYIAWTNITTRQLMGTDGGGGYWGIDSNANYEAYVSSSVKAVLNQRDFVVNSWDSSTGIYSVNSVDTGLGGRGTVNNTQLLLLSLNGGYNCKARLYGFRAFSTTATLSDMIPCYRKLDGKPGMYDVIRDQFFVSANSSEFLLGPSVGLPSRYRQVEYIESSGTQYIYLQLPSNNVGDHYGLDVQFLWTELNSATSAQNFICGGDYAAPYYENPRIFTYQGNISGTNLSEAPVANKIYHATRVNSYSITTAGTNYNYRLFGSTGYGQVSKSRIYFYRFYLNKQIRLDLIPVYDTQTKQYGMFDIVNQKFYANAGTGTFTAGPFTGFTECVYPPIAQRTIEYDISGYGRNGTYNSVDGRLFSSNSSRYSSSTEFQDNNTSINIGNLSTMVPEGNFTFNIWFYKSSLGDAYDTIFGGPSGFELETRAGGTGTEPKIEIHSWNNTTFDYQWNTWHMLTMVRTTSETLWYLDGQHQITGSAGTIPSGDYFIGAWRSATEQNYKGKIADARIYATALSADAIKELYSLGGSV